MADEAQRMTGYPTNEDIEAAMPRTAPKIVLYGAQAPVKPDLKICLPLPTTSQGDRCLMHAAAALELFINKNSAYGEPDGDDLGSRGQYAELHRKWKRLRRHLWDGEPWPEQGESFQMVMYDFIGHILLAIDWKEGEGK